MSDLRKQISSAIRRSNSSGLDPVDKIVSLVLDEAMKSASKRAKQFVCSDVKILKAKQYAGFSILEAIEELKGEI